MDASKTKIEIFDLRYPVRIGCSEEERSKPQELAFDIEIDLDAMSSCKSDNLNQTICYMQVSQLMHEMAEKHVVSLIERFAWLSVEEIFKRFPMAEKIRFKIRKFSTVPQAGHVAFELKINRPR
mgnify:CR=1 FL=1